MTFPGAGRPLLSTPFSNLSPLPALLRPEKLRGLLPPLLLALLAWQAARLFWILASPPAPVGALAPAPVAVAAAAFAPVADPFFRTGPANGLVAVAPSELRLFATRLTPAPASAILQWKEAPQAVLLLGEALDNGMVLAEVHTGHVLLRDAAGGSHRLELPATEAAAPASPPPASALPSAAPPAAAAVAPAELLQGAGLLPAAGGGYTVVARGDGQALRQAGLQAGDVLMSVNGSPLTPETLTRLQDELSAGDQATLTVQRGGKTQTLQFRTRPL